MAATQLPAGTSEADFSATVAGLKEAIASRFAVAATGKEKTVDVLYQIALNLLSGAGPQFKQGIAVVFAVLLFFTLKAVGIVFGLVATAVAFILYQLLLATKLLPLGTEMVEKQTVIMK